jgi:hypothetical protein
LLANARNPIEIIEGGITIEARLVSKNAPSPIDVTPFGSVTDVNDGVAVNNPSLIDVTLSGIVIEAILVRLNAS